MTGKAISLFVFRGKSRYNETARRQTKSFINK